MPVGPELIQGKVINCFKTITVIYFGLFVYGTISAGTIVDILDTFSERTKV